MFEFGSEPKTGLARAVTVLATIFLVSLGLCGVNFIAVISRAGGKGGEWLGVTAYLEMAGMMVGAGGLIVVGVFAVVMRIVEWARGKEGE